jgi:hypothetical protein
VFRVSWGRVACALGLENRHGELVEHQHAARDHTRDVGSSRPAFRAIGVAIAWLPPGPIVKELLAASDHEGVTAC